MLALGLVAVAPGATPPASAAPAPAAPTFSFYAGATDPMGLTVGPDGALWFTTFDSIGRITTTGSVTDYTSPANPGIEDPEWITAGPDGAMWFNNQGESVLGRLTTAAPTPG